MHDCIACGCACYCHGDIDDCVVESWEYSAEHCETCGCGQDPDGFDDDDLGILEAGDLFDAPDADRRQVGQRAACIGCGCDDDHACPDGCYWLRVDYEAGAGVCSECEQHLEAWDRGDRTSHAPGVAQLEAEAAEILAGEHWSQIRHARPRPRGWSTSTCPHDWPRDEPRDGDACTWCGMSFIRYVFTQCP